MNIHYDQPFHLSIDKISFTCNDINPNRVEQTCHRLNEFAEDKFGGLHIKPGIRHHLQAKWPIPSSTSSLLIQAGNRHSGISNYRFEFNPSIIGPDGMSSITSFINSLTDTGTQHLFTNGKVTRIDFALDLADLSLDEVVLRSMGQRKHAVYTSGQGTPETVYLGTTKANRTVAYTKSYDDNEFLRIERRMKPNCKGHELAGLSNPFNKIQLISTESLLPYLDGMIPRQFFDSVRMRGIGHVLADLKPGQRRQIKSVLSDPEQSLLPSMDLIWNDWPALLSRSGLGALCVPMEASEAA